MIKEYNVERKKYLKKNIIIIALILLLLIIICVVGIRFNSKTNRVVKQENREYEQYLDSEIYGTDVITLINRAISSNENNQIEKDEKGLYLPDSQNSVMIELVMITNEEKRKTTTYRMETISKVGTAEFIKNFNTAKFKCTKKDYHKSTGKIAYIELSQQYE